MPIQQREAPCWQSCAPGEKPGDEGSHWATAEEARRNADPGGIPQPFPSPCWEGVCDGLPGAPCDQVVEDYDYGFVVHAGNAADMHNFAEREGWETGDDGSAQCVACVDEQLKQAEDQSNA